MAARGHLSLDVYDADGRVIEELITAFDTETGLVEYYVIGTDGMPVKNENGSAFLVKVAHYPAPLAWKRVTPEVVAGHRERLRQRALERQDRESR